VVSFISVYAATRYVYPPRKINFWLYEKVINYRERLTWIVILSNCYIAFAQGSNNVANAVGPLVSAGLIDTFWGLLIMGTVFGVGAFIFTGPLNTSSEGIVPLGLITATIINVISGSITIAASKLGLPLPTVIVYTVSIFAIGSVKDGIRLTAGNPVTKKTFFTWIINPFLTFWITYALAHFVLHK
jgi:sulfate permease